MEKYNYYEAVYNDVKDYGMKNIELSDYYDSEDNSFDMSQLSEDLNDNCWIDDAITGNGSGSYTFNRWQAAEYLSHNWDLMEEAANEGFEPQDRFSPEVCEELEETVKLEYGEDVVIW